MNKFWESASESLSTRLLTKNGPALVFWLFALLVWVQARSDWATVSATLEPLFMDTNLPTLLAWVLAGVVVTGASTLVVDRLTLPVLRLLEGYGPLWFNWLRRRRVKAWTERIGTLQSAPAPEPGSDSGVTVAQTLAQLRELPSPPDTMPTRIGNILRAGERRPRQWYGLDPIIVWPQLWLVLPEQGRTDITDARTQLNRTVAALIWAALSILLAKIWWPALLSGLLLTAVIWRWWIPDAARTYGNLLSALFDTHRFSLYDSVGFPRPTGPGAEYATGEQLTQYLWTGTGAASIEYSKKTGTTPSPTVPEATDGL